MQAEVGTGLVGVAAQHAQAVDAHGAGVVDAHGAPEPAGVPLGRRPPECWNMPVMLRRPLTCPARGTGHLDRQDVLVATRRQPVMSKLCGKK